RQIVDRRTILHARVFETDGAGDAVAKLSGVLDAVDAGVGVLPAHQERRDVGREALPGRGVSRGGTAEGEAGKLDEDVFNRNIAAADAVQEGAVEPVRNCRDRTEYCIVGRGEVVELEVALTIGTHHAIFGRGAGIDLQRHARARDEVVEVPVALAGVTAPRRS